ncbi:MAG: ACP phosphodiesterase [Planctomycetota bacterium]
MNWLAHLRLAPTAPLLRLGNLAGDFVRGVDITTLHPDLRAGIHQHRAIDRFVDAHALVRGSRHRLDVRFRRFAGVLVDVYYDHFLARDWAVHGDGRTLALFVDEVHAQLREHAALLPPRLQQVLPHMQRQAWLAGYAKVEGIDTVLQNMARRVARPTPLADGGAELRAQYEALDGDFAAFWPELAAFASDLG